MATEVQIIISARDLASQAFKGVTSTIQNTVNQMDRLASTAQAISLRSGIAFAGMVAGITKVTRALDEQEQAERKLEAAIRGSGQAISTQKIAAYAAELQKLTTFGDEATIEAAAMLATFQLTEKQIIDLIPRVQNLAAMYGLDLHQAAVQVGRAMTAGAGALSRYGITMTDAEKKAFNMASTTEKVSMLLEILDKNTGPAARALVDRVGGAATQTANLFGDLQEEMGRIFEPRLVSGFHIVSRAISDVISTLQNMDAKTKDNIARWTLLGTAVLGGITALGLAVSTVGIVAKGLALLGAAISFVTSPWMIGAALIIAAVAAIKAAWDNNWGGIQDKTRAVWAKIEPIVSKIAEFGGKALKTAWDWLIEARGNAWEWIRDTAIPWLKEHLGPPLKIAWNWAIEAAGNAWEWLRDVAWPWLTKQAIPTAWNWTVTAAGDFWEWLQDKAWPWLRESAKTAWNWTVEASGNAWEWLRDVAWPWLGNTARTVWNWVVEGAGNAWDWLRDTAWPWVGKTVKSVWQWVVEGANEIIEVWKQPGLTTGEKIVKTVRIIAERVEVVAKSALDVIREKAEKVVIPAIIDWQEALLPAIQDFRKWLGPVKENLRKWFDEAALGTWDLTEAFKRGIETQQLQGTPEWVRGLVEIGINAGKILGQAMGAAIDIGEIIILAIGGSVNRVARYLAEVGAYLAGRFWAALGIKPSDVEAKIEQQLGIPGLGKLLQAIFQAEGGMGTKWPYGTTQFAKQGYKFLEQANQQIFDELTKGLGLTPKTREWFAAASATTVMWYWEQFKKQFKLAQDTTMAALSKEQRQAWIKFLGERYAPERADALNRNWIPNVTKLMEQAPKPEEYELTEWAQRGVEMADALIKGIRQKFTDIGKSVSDTFKASIETVTEWIEIGKEIGNRLIRGIRETFTWENLVKLLLPTTLMPGMPKKAEGHQRGVILPGYGGGDIIPALLEPGEAVVPAKVVRGGLAEIVEWFRSMGVLRLQAGAVPRISIPAGIDPALAKSLGTTQDWIAELGRSISSIGKAIISAFATLFEWIGDVVLSLAKGLLGEERYNQIAAVVGTLKERMKELMDALFGVEPPAQQAADAIEKSGEAIKQSLPWWQQLGEFFKKFTSQDTLTMLKAFQQGFVSGLEEAGNAWAGFVARIVDSIELVVDDTTNLISVDWKQTIVNLANYGLSKLGEAIGNLFGGTAARLAREYPGGAYGEVNYPDLARMRRNYEDWNKNVAALQAAQQAQATMTVGGGVVGGFLGFLASLLIPGVGPLLGIAVGAGLGAGAGYAAGQAIYGPQIDELKKKLEDTFQKIAEALGTTISDAAGALGNAFSADTYQGFLAGFAGNLESTTKQGLIKAFMAGEIMRPLLQKLSDFMTTAVWDGVLSAEEKLGLQQKFQEIVAVAGPFWEALKEFDFAKALGLATDAANEFAESLRNVPTGFKIAVTRWEVALPAYQEGGYVGRTGLALLHAGEFVLTAAQARAVATGRGVGREVHIHNHYHLEGANIYGWDDFKRRVARADAENKGERGLANYGFAGAMA
ncbi:MAG: phage tail protein [Betaproteobacteria bacterium]